MKLYVFSVVILFACFQLVGIELKPAALKTYESLFTSKELTKRGNMQFPKFVFETTSRLYFGEYNILSLQKSDIASLKKERLLFAGLTTDALFAFQTDESGKIIDPQQLLRISRDGNISGKALKDVVVVSGNSQLKFFFEVPEQNVYFVRSISQNTDSTVSTLFNYRTKVVKADSQGTKYRILELSADLKMISIWDQKSDNPVYVRNDIKYGSSPVKIGTVGNTTFFGNSQISKYVDSDIFSIYDFSGNRSGEIRLIDFKIPMGHLPYLLHLGKDLYGVVDNFDNDGWSIENLTVIAAP